MYRHPYHSYRRPTTSPVVSLLVWLVFVPFGGVVGSLLGMKLMMYYHPAALQSLWDALPFYESLYRFFL
jgi:hypothetical protein